MAFLRARERSRSSLRFFSSVSRAVSRLNRLLVVSSAAQCVNYRAESLAMRTESRERGPALLTCTDEEGGTSCRRKNWGDDLFRREKPLDVRARSRPFLVARAPGRGLCMGLHHYMPVKFPVSTVCRRSLAEKHNFLSLENHVRAGSRPVCPRAPRRDWCNSPFRLRSQKMHTFNCPDSHPEYISALRQNLRE